MRLQSSESDRIVVFARGSTGTGVTGATVTLKIRRLTDGQYWNGTAWQAGVATVSMTQTDPTNLPGAYHYVFTPGAAAHVLYFSESATPAVANLPLMGEGRFGGWPDSIDQAVSSLVDAMLDEEVSGHLTAGSLGDYVNQIKKVVANNLVKNQVTNIVTIKQDDGTNDFASYKSTNAERTKQ